MIRSNNTRFYDRSYVNYEEEEIFFNQTNILIGGPSKNHTLIPTGLQKFDFEFKLPLEIPGTASGSFASIKYEIEARLDVPWKFDLGVKKAIVVIRIEDLNLYPELKQSQEKEITRNVGYLCCVSGPLIFRASIRKSGFAIGENLVISIEYSNSSNRKVSGTLIKLFKCEKYTCIHKPSEKRGLFSFSQGHNPGDVKFVSIHFLQSRAEGCIENSENSFRHSIKIPSNIPIINEKYSRLFQVYYELKVSPEFAYFGDKSLTFPITIGNVAIRD